MFFKKKANPYPKIGPGIKQEDALDQVALRKIIYKCREHLKIAESAIGKYIVYLGKVVIVKDVIDAMLYSDPNILLAWMDKDEKEVTATISYRLFETLMD